MITISLITPCFNLSNYIHETYNFLLNQTMTDWEWVIVDDESSDNTVEIIRSFKDSRIKLILSKHYGNLSVLRNIGANEAKGEILFFVDGDDLFVKDKIEVQVRQFEQYPQIGWSHTNALTLVDETNELLPRGMRTPPDAAILTAEEAFASLVQGNYLYISSVAVRKSVFISVGGFNEQFNRCEDIDLWLRLSASGYDLGYIAEPKLHYRVRKSGLYSTKQIEYLKANFIVFNRVRELFPSLTEKYDGLIRKHFSNVYFKMGIVTVREGGKGATMLFSKSLTSRFSLKRLGWLMMTFLFPSFTRNYILKRQSVI